MTEPAVVRSRVGKQAVYDDGTTRCVLKTPLGHPASRRRDEDGHVFEIVAERRAEVRVEDALPLDGERRLRVTALRRLEEFGINDPAARAGNAGEVLDGLRRDHELRKEDGPVPGRRLHQDLDGGHEATQEVDRILDD